MDSRPPSSLRFLDEREQRLVRSCFAVIQVRSPEEMTLLSENFQRLAQLAGVIQDSPRLLDSYHARDLGGTAAEPLIALLCRVPEYDLDLHVPTKAVIGQAYLVAKINFLKALRYAVTQVGGPEELRTRLDEEVGQSIYSKLAEELFISILTEPSSSPSAKQAAAGWLFKIWDERLFIEIDDYAPLLESIWNARNRVRPVLGTMLGTHEVFRLMREAEDGRFVEYFTYDGVPEEQLQAFEEFLFGLSYEAIRRLRDHARDRRVAVVSVDEARELLAPSEESLDLSGDPQGLYTSYKRRRLKAHYRTLTGAPGPKRTAEEYVMSDYLERGWKT